jgi:methyl-accepting chemotaxis protein
VNRSGARVEHGGSLVSDAGRTMQDIVTQVQRVNVLIGEITTAAHEQTQGITQVGHAVERSWTRARSETPPWWKSRAPPPKA